MPTIIDYAIARAIEVADLRNEVAELIRQGWQPFGSLTSAACYLNNAGNLPYPGESNLMPRVMYAQALVKYEDSS